MSSSSLIVKITITLATLTLLNCNNAITVASSVSPGDHFLGRFAIFSGTLGPISFIEYDPTDNYDNIIIRPGEVVLTSHSNAKEMFVLPITAQNCTSYSFNEFITIRSENPKFFISQLNNDPALLIDLNALQVDQTPYTFIDARIFIPLASAHHNSEILMIDNTFRDNNLFPDDEASYLSQFIICETSEQSSIVLYTIRVNIFRAAEVIRIDEKFSELFASRDQLGNNPCEDFTLTEMQLSVKPNTPTALKIEANPDQNVFFKENFWPCALHIRAKIIRGDKEYDPVLSQSVEWLFGALLNLSN
ncbi:hypothetical protein COTS27_00263 [Spirochaetota bacterium]|nr:hypothetical protein COTS27_00263 [Spirochaetota bacterium]